MRLQGFSKKAFDAVADDAQGRKGASLDPHEVLASFNTILGQPEFDFKLEARDIFVSPDRLISDIPNLCTRRLSRFIFDKYFPPAIAGCYDHFTSIDAFSSIVQTKTLWLFNLLKRGYFTKEYRHFYDLHNYTGYLQESNNGEPNWRRYARDVFYFCFTPHGALSEENHMWRDFGDSGNGVRITFEVNPKEPDFRRVGYSSDQNAKGLPLLLALNDTSISQFDKFFVPYQVSKMGAFFIKGAYEKEAEARLVIKRGTDDYDFKFQSISTKVPDVTRIEVPFDSEHANIKIVALQPGPYADENALRSLTKKIYPEYPPPEILPRASVENYQLFEESQRRSGVIL